MPCRGFPGKTSSRSHWNPESGTRERHMSLLQIVIIAMVMAAALSAVMAAAWRVQQTTDNAGWVDVFWTFGLGAVAIIASLAPLGQDHWPRSRQIAVAAVVGLWSLRLGWHILKRTRASGDDPRYRQLITQWGSNAPHQMLWQVQKQAAVSVIFALSIVLAAQNPHPRLRVQDMLGLATLMLAIVGESVADHQLRRFKADPANRNAVCDTGLWRLSRHPNYFFEWLSWLAYPLIAIDLSGYNPYGWLALLGPACMYWVLVHVSGIPPLEEHMLRSRPEAFCAYRRRTRPFFPFLKI
jgi:steroid 5-alpha reductase family enzyme